MSPLYAKALVIANDTTKIGIVTVDAVGILGDLVDRIHARAVSLGSTLPRDNLIVAASHTHSGPGTQTNLKFWEYAGTDLLFARLRDSFVADCAQVLFDAEQRLQPATLGAVSDHLAGVTVNRRSDVSPNVTPDSVDDEIGVIRIDRKDGKPLALVWNFAIHGTAYDATNLEFSPDIMGAVSDLVETQLGVVALFANGAEGDTAPAQNGSAGIQKLAPIIAQKILAIRAAATTQSPTILQCVSTVEHFGKATLDLSLPRLAAGSTGLDLSALASTLHLGSVTFTMGKDWFENDYRFQAIRVNDTLVVPIPGEPIYFVGRQMKQDGQQLGFNRTFIFGLSNGHMAYITTPAEYAIGGYEGIATFFGPHTADLVRAAAMKQMVKVKP